MESSPYRGILIRQDFLDHIPSSKENFVVGKLIKFSTELERHKGIVNNMPKGFWVSKLKTRDDIYKFRLNSGDRILFTYYDKLSQDRDEYKDSMVFLDYCRHDKQAVRGKSINLNTDLLELEINTDSFEEYDQIDRDIESIPEDKLYNFDSTITYFVKDDSQLALLLDKGNQDYIFYLNQEQYECLRKKPPLFISGSAGSGKTTIGIHILLSSAKSGLRIAYFTYTKPLKEYAKRIYEKYKMVGVDTEPDFYYFNNFCQDAIQVPDKYVISYPRFYRWFGDNQNLFKRLEKFDTVDLWAEIRGIIKGFMGYRWIRKRVFHRKLISSSSYDFLLENKLIGELKGIDRSFWRSKESLEEITRTIAEKAFPEESEEIRTDTGELIEHLKDKSLDEPLIDHAAYMDLSTDQSRFSLEQRERIYDLAKRYQKWLDDQEMLDENDLARRTLKKILSAELEKYDLIVCDEVQDLSEIQIYTLYNLVRDKKSIIFSGDIHQIVNPTYFSFGRIGELFYKSGITPSESQLKKNYRSQEKIVVLANMLSDIRKKLIGSYGFDDYKEIFIRHGNRPFLLEPTSSNENALLETVKEKAYAILVVPDEQERATLQSKIAESGRIFTVQEVKGLEYQYVVCYNLITKHSECWEEIFSNMGKRSAKHRYYFNLLYVAITRARENLCLYEANQDSPLLRTIIDHFEHIETFDEEQLALETYSTRDEWERDAEYLERNERYAEAARSYRKAFNEEGMKRCEAKRMASEGEYEKAGDLMLEIREYENALEFFQRANSKLKQLITMLHSCYDFNNIDKHFRAQECTVLDLDMDDKQINSECASLFINNYLKPKLDYQSEVYDLIRMLVRQGVDLSKKGNKL